MISSTSSKDSPAGPNSKLAETVERKDEPTIIITPEKKISKEERRALFAKRVEAEEREKEIKRQQEAEEHARLLAEAERFMAERGLVPGFVDENGFPVVHPGMMVDPNNPHMMMAAMQQGMVPPNMPPMQGMPDGMMPPDQFHPDMMSHPMENMHPGFAEGMMPPPGHMDPNMHLDAHMMGMHPPPTGHMDPNIPPELNHAQFPPHMDPNFANMVPPPQHQQQQTMMMEPEPLTMHPDYLPPDYDQRLSHPEFMPPSQQQQQLQQQQLQQQQQPPAVVVEQGMPAMQQPAGLPDMIYAPPTQEPVVSAPAMPQQFLPTPGQVSSSLVAPSSSDANLMPPPPAPPRKAKKKRVTFDPDIPDDEPSTTSVDTPGIGQGQQKVRKSYHKLFDPLGLSLH